MTTKVFFFLVAACALQDLATLIKVNKRAHYQHGLLILFANARVDSVSKFYQWIFKEVIQAQPLTTSITTQTLTKSKKKKKSFTHTHLAVDLTAAQRCLDNVEESICQAVALPHPSSRLLTCRAYIPATHTNKHYWLECVCVFVYVLTMCLRVC